MPLSYPLVLIFPIEHILLPYFFDIFKDLIEIGPSSHRLSPCGTHAKTRATCLFCLAKNETLVDMMQQIGGKEGS